jgi:hypothetical protein
MQINGVNFTIGADPEVFMGKNGQFISAHDAVPGDKLKPFKVDKGAVQVDGMALEFNIDPANSLKEFQENLDCVQNILFDMIGDKEFLDTPSVFFDEEFLKNVPVFNQRLGCSVDYNAWSMEPNDQPDSNALMRTAGGHVHIGGFFSDNPFKHDHFNTCARLARILDEKLGVYSILWDEDDKRRELYGKAGSFRPKNYGMEYRTLSNKWIFNKSLIEFVYKSVEEALVSMFDQDYDVDKSVRKIIDESKRDSESFMGNEKVGELKCHL